MANKEVQTNNDLNTCYALTTNTGEYDRCSSDESSQKDKMLSVLLRWDGKSVSLNSSLGPCNTNMNMVIVWEISVLQPHPRIDCQNTMDLFSY